VSALSEIQRDGEKLSRAKFSLGARNPGRNVVRRRHGEAIVRATRDELHEEKPPMALAAAAYLVMDRLAGREDRFIAAEPGPRFGGVRDRSRPRANNAKHRCENHRGEDQRRTI
jgi:hypothetical protein